MIHKYVPILIKIYRLHNAFYLVFVTQTTTLKSGCFWRK